MDYAQEQDKNAQTDNHDLIVNNLLNINPTQIQENSNSSINISDNISKGYQIIEDIQSNKVDKLQGMKDFLLNLDVITKNVDKSEYQDSIIEDLKKIIEESKKDVTDLIENSPSTQVISSCLDTILIRIEGALANKKNKKSESLHFEKIDELYLKMYQAMENDDQKKVALYRGRLIRELKKEKKTISQMYENAKSLEEINTLINDNASLDQVKEILSKEENKEYANLLNSYLNNENNFRTEFQKLYDDKEVRRIVLYNNALKEELKAQRIYYKKRYDEEFLGKKGNILTMLKSIPTAIALSVKSIANSINELKEAKTNKMKLKKTIDVLKDVGKLAITPIVATGKFAMSNWYTLLQLYRGPYQALKEKNAENSIEQEQKIQTNPESRTQSEQEIINEKKYRAEQDLLADQDAQNQAKQEAKIQNNQEIMNEKKYRAEQESNIEQQFNGAYDTNKALDPNSNSSQTQTDDTTSNSLSSGYASDRTYIGFAPGIGPFFLTDSMVDSSKLKAPTSNEIPEIPEIKYHKVA